MHIEKSHTKNPQFTFGRCDIVTFPPGATLGTRLAVSHEIIWIIEGDVTWTYNGVTHAMPPGSFIIRPPGSEEHFCWDPAHPTRHAFIEFDVLAGCTNSFMDVKWPVSLITEPDSILPLLLRHIISLCQKRDAGWEELSTHALNCCISMYASNLAAVRRVYDKSPALSPPMRRIIDHVSNAWGPNEGMRKFSIEDLMAIGNVSRAQLFRLFMKSFDMPPMQALCKARLERAAVLLIRTELRVQEIALLTGFEVPFHFSNRFKQHFGICPTDFRKQQRARQSFFFNTSLLSRLLHGYEG